MAVDAVARIALLHLNGVRVAPRLASIAWDAHSLARTSAELGERHDREEEEHEYSRFLHVGPPSSVVVVGFGGVRRDKWTVARRRRKVQYRELDGVVGTSDPGEFAMRYI